MKQSFLTHLPLALLLTLGATSATLAGPGDHGPGRSEVRAYVQANVLPVVRQQRQQLEAQLAPADRAQLATYRTQLQAVRTQEQALHQQLHAPGTDPQVRPEPTEAQRQQLHDLRAQTRAILASVAQMAQKYDTNIAQLTSEIVPQQAKWIADFQAMAAKSSPADQSHFPASLADAPGPRPDRMGHHGPDGFGGPGHHGLLMRYFQPVAFLLMPAKEEAPVTFGGTALYPNPATAATQLQYDVKQVGPVTIDLLDAQGTRLRTLVQQPQQTLGTHTEALDFGDLPSGTYYYKITTGGSTETKRFVKQ